MRLFLFDVDGTIADSGQPLSESMIQALTAFVEKNNVHLGIVGGGVYSTIQRQIQGAPFRHIFSECGSVYHCQDRLLYQKDIRRHKLFPKMQELVKRALHFLSTVQYPLSGHMVDRRNGLIYISLIGMQATEEERAHFLALDKIHKYREQLLHLLQQDCQHFGIEEQLSVMEGGAVGISIFPIEYDKIQVYETLAPLGYDEIHYFGDKYTPNGNDYRLLSHPEVKGHPVKSVSETLNYLLSPI